LKIYVKEKEFIGGTIFIPIKNILDKYFSKLSLSSQRPLINFCNKRKENQKQENLKLKLLKVKNLVLNIVQRWKKA